ncbi:hypothetical protein CEXT_335911 [Caerostris extrusa]|uniref:Uncharacterized protein n=1 Tax=Caerostris extrusa TaxID=172846 RepID=A0AAV4TZ32_CAEEX|nr:hypothetical protein CEXT_335911 [Caerostris extrusa]
MTRERESRGKTEPCREKRCPSPFSCLHPGMVIARVFRRGSILLQPEEWNLAQESMADIENHIRSLLGLLGKIIVFGIFWGLSDVYLFLRKGRRDEMAVNKCDFGTVIGCGSNFVCVGDCLVKLRFKLFVDVNPLASFCEAGELYCAEVIGRMEKTL